MNLLEEWLLAANPADAALADEKQALTYGAAIAAIEERADFVRETGAVPQYVLLPAHKSVSFIVDLLAVSCAGHVPVPVDPAAPHAIHAAMAAQCRSASLLVGDELRALSSKQASISPGQTALLLFTSGTSGTPKGVPVSWGNLAHSVKTVAAYLGYAEHTSAAVVLPLHYSYALLTQLLAMLYVGGSTRIFGSFRNPIKFARSVNEFSLATFCGVPSTYQSMAMIHRMQPLSMPSVRVLCSAGAAMDRTLLPEIHEMFPNARFFDNYGMTEATPRISFVAHDDPRFAEPTCGRAIDGLEIRIYDEQDNLVLPDGQHGIVAVRGPNVFDGYLNDEAATARVFNKDGFLLSGDIGFMRDGYLYIVGRADDVFNIGGEKVAPLEIERALNEHPEITAAAVGRLEDSQRGVVAVAYLELSGEVSRRQLLEFLGERLTPVKVPQRFIQVSGFPLTTNGKLQRSRLSLDDETYVIGEIG